MARVLRGGGQDTDTQGQACEGGRALARRGEASEGTSPADTLISDFQHPGMIRATVRVAGTPVH